jgi:hypothetical protein
MNRNIKQAYVKQAYRFLCSLRKPKSRCHPFGFEFHQKWERAHKSKSRTARLGLEYCFGDRALYRMRPMR